MIFGQQVPASDAKFAQDLSSAFGAATGPDAAIQTLINAMKDVPNYELSQGERSTLLKTIEFMVKDGHMSCSEASCLAHMISEYAGAGSPQFQYSLGEMLGMAYGLTSSDGTMLSLFSQLTQSSTPGCGVFCGTGGRDPLPGFSMGDMLQGALAGTTDNAWSGALEGAFADADFASLSGRERTTLAGMVFGATADGVVTWPEASSILRTLNRFQNNGEHFSCPCPCECPADQPWSVEQNGSNATIDLGDYTLEINEKRSEFILTNKETGESSRIWGDPHFDMDNNGTTDVDFWGTMTMNLANGTKITIQTTPWKGNANMTVSSRLIITQGDKAIDITGMDQNSIGDMQITQSDNGVALDAFTGDGLDIYEQGGTWMVRDGLGFREATQADMNTTKGDQSDFDLMEAFEALNLMSGSLFSVMFTAMFAQAFGADAS